MQSEFAHSRAVPVFWISQAIGLRPGFGCHERFSSASDDEDCEGEDAERADQRRTNSAPEQLRGFDDDHCAGLDGCGDSGPVFVRPMT